MSVFDELDELIRSGSDQELASYIRKLRQNNININYLPYLEAALSRGQIERIVYLLNLLDQNYLTTNILRSAGQLRGRGSRYLVEKIASTFHKSTQLGVIAASAAYYPEFNSRVHYLISRGADNFGDILANAVRGNNILLIQEILRQYKPRFLLYDILQPISQAAVECNLPILQYLLRQYTLTSQEIEEIAKISRTLISHTEDSREVRKCQEVVDFLESQFPEEDENSEFYFYEPIE